MDHKLYQTAPKIGAKHEPGDRVFCELNGSSSIVGCHITAIRQTTSTDILGREFPCMEYEVIVDGLDEDDVSQRKVMYDYEALPSTDPRIKEYEKERWMERLPDEGVLNEVINMVYLAADEGNQKLSISDVRKKWATIFEGLFNTYHKISSGETRVNDHDDDIDTGNDVKDWK